MSSAEAPIKGTDGCTVTPYTCPCVQAGTGTDGSKEQLEKVQELTGRNWPAVFGGPAEP